MNGPASEGHSDRSAESVLREQVLPLFRTRAELYRWPAVREYGQNAAAGVDLLREFAASDGAALVLPYVQKAIASTVRVVLRADDSTGVIGDVARSLLRLHAELAGQAPPPVVKLVKWLIGFQFDGVQDFFDIDIVAYLPALGPVGLSKYRAQLDAIGASLLPEPAPEVERLLSRNQFEQPEPHLPMVNDRHARFLLQYNRKRLAVADHDRAGIIREYGGDQAMAYRLHDAAKALMEIGDTDGAIDYSLKAAGLPPGHQAQNAAHYWCELLTAEHPDQVEAARQWTFTRWPNSTNAAKLRQVSTDWPRTEPAVLTALEANPRDLILFLLLTLNDPVRAWAAAARLQPDDGDLWARLVDAYQQIDPAAVLPVLRRLIDGDLEVADAANYRSAVQRLRQYRTISAGVGQTDAAREYTTLLREQNRNRPRFLKELGKANFL
ncbi:DUF6880 family protein [Subtercola vilae]|uniref:DUF6880 family protein n=1 Tax=Subtercola vilae TaxID=2056433 RepID=UPI00308462A8